MVEEIIYMYYILHFVVWKNVIFNYKRGQLSLSLSVELGIMQGSFADVKCDFFAPSQKKWIDNMQWPSLLRSRLK